MISQSLFSSIPTNHLFSSTFSLFLLLSSLFRKLCQEFYTVFHIHLHATREEKPNFHEFASTLAIQAKELKIEQTMVLKTNFTPHLDQFDVFQQVNFHTD